MKIRLITYPLAIITGIMILIFGVHSGYPDMEKYFGIFLIVVGLLSLAIDLMRHEEYKKKRKYAKRTH